MPLYADRVQETFTTSGTGAVTLLGAVTGYRNFASAYAPGDRVSYAMTDGTNWEVGSGTLGAPQSLANVLYDWNGDKAQNVGSNVAGTLVDSIAGVVLAPTASPTWNKLSAINGHVGIGFDGATSELTCASGVNASQAFEIWNAIELNAWTSTAVWLGGASCAVCANGTTPDIGLFAGGAAREITNGNLALNTWGIVRSVFNGLSSTVTVGGGSAAGTGMSPGSLGLTGAFALGNWTGGSQFGQCTIARTIITSPLSTGQANAMLAYLETLYNLSPSPSLSRDTILASSNGGAAVSWSGAAVNVFADLPGAAISDNGFALMLSMGLVNQ